MESIWNVFYPGKYANPMTDTDETLYMRIKKISKRYPSRIALEFGAKKYTYSAFFNKIVETANCWRKLGVRKGDKVLLLMGHNPMNLISLFALDKLGASAALAVPNLSTEYFVEYANSVGASYCVMSGNQYWNYSSVLKNTKIRTVVIGKYRSMISGIDRFSFYFDTLAEYDKPKPQNCPEGIRRLTWQEVTELPDVESDQHLAGYDRDNEQTTLYLFPSEGEHDKKFLALSAKHVNLVVNLLEMVYMANEDLTGKPARFLCLNENCFSFGLIVGVLGVLFFGQTVLQFTWYDPDRIFYAIKRYRPDVLIGYNSTVAIINKVGPKSDILKSVDRILVGGLLTSTQKALLYETAQNSRGNLSICSVTGCDDLTAYAYAPSDLQSDRLLGFPLPGVLMRVVDSVTGLDMPAGEEGEIAVYSDVLSNLNMSANDPEKKKYRKLPDGRIWFFTGNIGKQDENKMFYLVRNRSRAEMVNGFPVFLDVIDSAVQMTEGVVESCSVLIERPEGTVLISAVIPQEKYFYDNTLIEDLRDRISGECNLTLHESMRPSEITFFVSLPRDSKNAIDYEAVKEKVLQVLDESSLEEPSSGI